MPAAAERNANEILLTRTFDAPRDLVFRAWTDPKHFAEWWGPHGSSIPMCEIDLRAGGTIRYAMRGTNFPEHRIKGEFTEVDPPSRLVFTQRFVDEHLPGLPADAYFLTTVDFIDRGAKTDITLRHAIVTSTESEATRAIVPMATAGWSQSLERLSSFVEGRDIIGRRVFDAPRDLVFRMWTEREHIERWWGPHGFTTTTTEMDVRPGGEWRFTMHGPDGRDYRNHIIYDEVVEPERIAYTHESTPRFHVRVSFDDLGGRTAVEMRMTFETAALRENTVKTFGAVEGLHQTLARLAEELASYAAA